MLQRKLGARAKYRLEEGQRVKDASTLSDEFHQLKSLTIDLEYFDPEGLTRNSRVRYSVNLANAKSVFRFNCPNQECVRGDFDLTEELAGAVAAHRTSLTGELACQGWRSKTAIDAVHCHNILRYKISLAY